MTTTNGRDHHADLAILPQVEWENYCYSSLQTRLDIFEDMVVATRYSEKREPTTFIVDPLDLVTSLSGVPVTSDLLPEGCLFWQRRDGHERIGIWIPPQVWRLRVEPTTRVNRVIPLPGFVFVGMEKRYNLWATATPERPAADTPLYYAPTPNISRDRRGVCQGSADFPVCSSATIWAAVAAFFESGFNNHLDNGKSKECSNSILAMWQKLHRLKAETYPVEDLVEARITLGEVINVDL